MPTAASTRPDHDQPQAAGAVHRVVSSEPAGPEQQPAGHDVGRLEPRGQRRAPTSEPIDHRDVLRQQPEARRASGERPSTTWRYIALDIRRDAGHHDAADQHDADQRGAERRSGEQAQVEQRVGQPALPADEAHAERGTATTTASAGTVPHAVACQLLEAVDDRQDRGERQGRRSPGRAGRRSSSRYSGSRRGPSTSSSSHDRDAEQERRAPPERAPAAAPPTSGPSVMPPMKQLNQTPIAVGHLLRVGEHVADQRHRRRHQRRAGDAEQRRGWR